MESSGKLEGGEDVGNDWIKLNAGLRGPLLRLEDSESLDADKLELEASWDMNDAVFSFLSSRQRDRQTSSASGDY